MKMATLFLEPIYILTTTASCQREKVARPRRTPPPAVMKERLSPGRMSPKPTVDTWSYSFSILIVIL